MSEEQTKKEMEAQDKKFAYKKPESAYANRNDPKKSATAQGKAFTGVSPMNFYMRQNAQKKAEKEKEHETKVGMYKNDLFKSTF
mmetsp:Transcript_25551/g.53196  ORF Transcript_25551/g.53196 Transcript_25551/m.53196 type:complete len:84 (-) Transcript_25551:1027-1278(-)